MSFNPSLKYPTLKYITTTTEPKETVSILSDDQSSYVLFNPLNSISDILSLTNTNNTNRISEESHGTEKSASNIGISNIRNNVDNLELGRTESLSNRINEWHMNSSSSDLIDDNIASWDLDEKLSIKSSLRNKFYGDELFKEFNKRELKKFKSFHLRNSMKQCDRSLINQLLMKVLINDEDVSSNQPEWTSRLSKKTKTYLRSVTGDNLDFSDATSSLVLCGGARLSHSL